MTKTIAQSHTHTTITLPVVNPDPTTPSIRQIMLGGIARGTPATEILAQVERYHPTTAGATKFKKHLAWYKTRAKKVGTPEYKTLAGLLAGLAAELAQVETEPVTEDVVTETETTAEVPMFPSSTDVAEDVDNDPRTPEEVIADRAAALAAEIDANLAE